MPAFERLWLTERFVRALQTYQADHPERQGSVHRVLNGYLTDLDTLQRSPLNNPKHRIFRTRVSRGDRMIDLPLTGQASTTMMLNIGDHEVNDWGAQYRGSPQEELRGARLHELSVDGREREAPHIDEAAAARTQLQVADSPWYVRQSTPGTYGELLTAGDLERVRVPPDLVPTALTTLTSVPLAQAGVEEAKAERLETMYMQRLPAQTIAAPVPGREVPAGVVVTREQLSAFLRTPLVKFLSKVSEEQQRLIERRPGSLMIVKGAAGTGKTVVGIRRIEHLIAGSLYDQRILFLCFNQVLRDAVYQVLSNVLGGPPEQLGVDVRTAYSWMGRLAYRHGIQTGLAIDHWRLAQLVTMVRRSVTPPTSRTETLNDAYIAGELAEIIYGRAMVKESEYLSFPRVGRAIPLQADERRYIWRISCQVQELYRSQGQIPWEAIPALLLEKVPPRSHPLYNAVIIDEAQDLLPSIFRLVRHVQAGDDSGFVVLGDAAQNLYRRSFRWSDTGLRVTGGHVTILRRCYRSTREIITAATPLIHDMKRHLGDDLVTPEATEHSGPWPEIILATTEDEEHRLVSEKVYGLIADGAAPSAIAVFARLKDTLSKLSTVLSSYGIPTEHYEKDDLKSIGVCHPSVKLLTPQSAKGIEFPFVFICGVTRTDYPTPSWDPERAERERRLLYTAMMRAAYQVTLSAVAGQHSELVGVIRSQLPG